MLRQNLSQKLLQKLSPQQIQLMKLLQIPTIALDQRIKEELEINPALEEGSDEIDSQTEDEFDYTNEEGLNEHDDLQRDDFNLDQYIDDDEIPSYKLNTKNSGEDDDRREIPLSGGISFHETLIAQLGLRDIDNKEYLIGENIIGNIDDDGYLRRDITAIIDDLAFSQNISTDEKEVKKIISIIQEFDPAGVGAKDLQECLLLQLKRKSGAKNHVIPIAIEIVRDMMEEFTKKHYDKIAKNLEIDDVILKDAIQEIVKLNPKPGNSFSEGQKSIQHIVPDFVMTNNDGELDIIINSRNAPDLRISKSYSDMLNEYGKSKMSTKDKKEAVAFVKQKIDAASWFIDALQQRQNTLMVTMQAIANYQYEYFLEGDETKLKPMILKDIAEIVGLDISTISRVANSKYIQTHFGTFSLKSFFSESLSTDSGEEVSTREVKKILEECIAAENKKKPVTDDKLMDILKEKGYNIARRTVAKYREQLNIPVARLRKEI